MSVTLLDIYNPDTYQYGSPISFLYKLLSQRRAYQNISHKVLPDPNDHLKFVESKPYKSWHIIMNEHNWFVGSIYLGKDDNVGIFLLEDFVGRGYGKAALKELYKLHEDVETIYANVAPLNSVSIAFFVNMGYKFYSTTKDDKGHIIQYTYEIANPENFYSTAGV